MSNIKWIKLSTSMFDDEKIKVIEQMPEADTVIVIWMKLLTMAGKINAGGFIMLTENIPYKEDMLLAVLNRPIATIRMALTLFQQFEMIEVWEDGRIYLPNWEKHQNVEGLEKIREQNRIRKQKQREKERLLLLEEPMSRDVTGQVTPSHATEEDLDLEEELEEEVDKETNNKCADSTNQHGTFSESFERFWNAYPKYRRRDRAKTYKLWQKAIKKIDEKMLHKCVELYANDFSVIGKNGEFAKMPSSFLNAQTYVDYVEAASSSNIPSSNHPSEDGCSPDDMKQAMELLRKSRGEKVE
ncbi:phage replisome organizer N-terminal domain-containing protein [Paenibacillus apiarius]|uniref:Phage replisome organizer N-terminal domain-containing protein n=1 Tax=Paenibacillus apiarius TaxID=46240 RepID=A0ABT4DVI0_9BACL|nr:phage replisome organizer N-terminal domain-containing protein [Paenibacillus apiarius]MCY9513278.1 phage replisome organizer N-terminal domain-containing protein [Paenibacillus apiarius]MCY9521363.1 phage replisome organizer N-terminal domain-containing protein [Paenibacillus apiarius]MCY9554491.1 phage replisome organizer N-terminal domain-containing protein [Paenibacillus apiarius]MCY9560694.1 phage replisome organizer N-terminal domain-containing protein [Paenibacillus apiarius]MCY96850